MPFAWCDPSDTVCQGSGSVSLSKADLLAFGNKLHIWGKNVELWPINTTME